MTTDKARQTVDTGTPEIHRQFTTKPSLISQKTGRATHIKVQDQTELDRLLLNNWISPQAFQAGEAFAGDIYRAGLEQLRAANYERVLGGGAAHDITQKEAFTRMKVHKAMSYIARRTSQEASWLAFDVARDQVRVNKSCAQGRLSEALAALSDFYARWV
jgi:hypothetical protein